MPDETNGITAAQRKPIRIFRAESMIHTPFDKVRDPSPILTNADISFVDQPDNAHLIIARRHKFLKEFGDYDKVFAVWTHEPAMSIDSDPIVQIPGIRNPVHVMNACTGDIYADEFYDFCKIKPDFDTAMRAFAAKPKRAVMLATYRNPKIQLFWDGVDRDLNHYRQNLALYLKDRGFCDIYGRRWPAHIDITGNSREGNWRESKQEILLNYAVNIAFENAVISKYITEKIWEAIVCACLPVYHGARNGIYRIFPKNSFIEADGKSVEDLGDEILAMPQDEMTARYEMCLRAYLAIYREDRRLLSRRACHLRTLDFLHAAVLAHDLSSDTNRIQTLQPSSLRDRK